MIVAGACLDEGTVKARLVMGCSPPSSWAKLDQGTLEARKSQPGWSRAHAADSRYNASTLLNFTPPRPCTPH